MAPADGVLRRRNLGVPIIYYTIANLITIVTLLWLWFDNMRLREKLNAITSRAVIDPE